MNFPSWPFALALAFSSMAMFAQDAHYADPCHAKPEQSKTTGFFGFDLFDKELRVALNNQDPVAMAFLVTFPLHVNDAGGKISLDDPAALKTHFQEVFTPAVRTAILSENTKEARCDIEGIGYGRGVLWVNASERGYAIYAINRDAVPPYSLSKNSPTIDYLCQTQTHRIAVDTTADGNLRYRSWNRPRAVTEIPDLEISNGVGTFEGTNVCAVAIYTFKNGGAVYKVDAGIGCGSADDGVPKNATGQIEVTLSVKRTSASWCYQGGESW